MLNNIIMSILKYILNTLAHKLYIVGL